MLSLEIDALRAQMTTIIVRDAEGYFDDPSERSNANYSQHSMRVLRVFAAVK
jgi:hypothetical protein